MMYVLYTLKLKLWLRRNPVSKSFYCANKPYTRRLKSNCFEGETRTLKYTRATLWRWRYKGGT